MPTLHTRVGLILRPTSFILHDEITLPSQTLRTSPFGISGYPVKAWAGVCLLAGYRIMG